MFGFSTLKRTLNVTAATVACPVAGCERTVRRQRKRFRRESEFLCQDHEIHAPICGRRSAAKTVEKSLPATTTTPITPNPDAP